MVQKALLILLAVLVASTGFAQELRAQRPARRGESAGYSSRDATTLSMMGWGLGLAVGIAALCALIPNNTGVSHPSSSVHAH